LSPLANFVQEGVQASLYDAATPMVYSTATHKVKTIVGFHFEIHIRNWQRMHLPQYIAFYKIIQKGVWHNTCYISHSELDIIRCYVKPKQRVAQREGDK
jgi:hypothetical protein